MNLALLSNLWVLLGLVLGVNCSSRTEIFFRALQDLSNPRPDYGNFNTIKNQYINTFKKINGVSETKLPYFKILPTYLGSFPPEATSQWLDSELACYTKLEIESKDAGNGTLELTIRHLDPNILCNRYFIVSTGSHFQIVELWLEHEKIITLESSGSPEEDWDLFSRGPRVFLYEMYPAVLEANLAATAALFEPVLTEDVGLVLAMINRDFLREYAGINMEESESYVVIPEHFIGDGDTFNIMRLDGLDPMIAWAMGSATGHTAVAMRRNGTLYLCESNAKSAYWPVNGVQCNLYADWLKYGGRNGYNVVWVPLKEEVRSTLNMTKAWEFVDAMYGIDYGYEVVLTGLLDTVLDNLPCIDAPEGKMCLVPEHLEMVFSYMERVSVEVSRVFKPAILQRAGVPFNSTLLQAYFAANQSGISPAELYTMPEQDGWLYETTRNGVPELSPVAICNAFVCNVWKAAGMFGDLGENINCGETSVNDNYRLNIYKDPDQRHEICKDQNPDNPNCQILGRYTLRLDSQPGQLPRYNYVDISPHMFENCPSRAPDYLAPTDC